MTVGERRLRENRSPAAFVGIMGLWGYNCGNADRVDRRVERYAFA
jgi:hypothetical protein